MRERYVRHFLHNVIELADGLGIYYVQDCFCDRNAFFGVELKTFFDHRQTVEWLRDCIAYDRCGIYSLRSFLVQSAPRRYMVHRMDNHRVMDEVARVIIDYHYPVVIRPWCEPPWRSSNTIDVICAIQNGAPLSVISRSPELDKAAKMLQATAKTQGRGAAHGFQQNLLAVNDIDPNDVDTARSPWDIERWKQEHQLRLAARRQALLPHSSQGWDDPDAPKKVIANIVKILAEAPRQILQHPIDSLIIEPVKEFVGMFRAPKAASDRDQARHDVLGRYYQGKDIDSNDLDTADHPGRAMQWADSHDKRHRNDRTPAIRHFPPPEDTEKILAMLITYLVARKYGKSVRSGSEGLSEESVQVVKKSTKSGAGNKGIPEVENPKAIEKVENRVKKQYDRFEKRGGPKKTKPIAVKKFKRKHLDGNPKDPYTLMPDGKPMGAEVGKVPSHLKGLDDLPTNHDKYVKDGWPSLDVEYQPGRHTRDFRNFTDAKPDNLKPGTKIYRIIDDQSGEFTKGVSGSYWTTEMPKNKTVWRKDFAVKDSWNDNGYVIEETVGSEALKVWRGGTAAQRYEDSSFFLSGGKEQIFVQRGAIGNPQPKLTNWPDL